jgi:hypothetical protein
LHQPLKRIQANLLFEVLMHCDQILFLRGLFWFADLFVVLKVSKVPIKQPNWGVEDWCFEVSFVDSWPKEPGREDLSTGEENWHFTFEHRLLQP